MALSPMMQHYLSVKEEHKDCIVFYRLGDFYEMFFDDAEKVSDLLGLTLTGKDCGLENRAPMCGIPYHAADVYIAKLIALGEKIAICEQLSDPSQSTGLVERGVVRIVTAGTLTEDNLIDEKRNNFIASVYTTDGLEFSIAWADITTGEFFVQKLAGLNSKELLSDKLVLINAAEIISNQKAYDVSIKLPVIVHQAVTRFTVTPEFNYTFDSAEKAVKQLLKVKTLDGIGLNDNLLLPPVGALLAYFNDTQKHFLSNVFEIKIIDDEKYLKLDSSAIRNLEITQTLRDGKRYGSLLWLLDKTKTGMGARTLNSWLLNPLLDKMRINERLDAVEEFYNNILVRQGISDLLKCVKDIARLSGKATNGNITPKDCNALKVSLSALPSIKFQLSTLSSKLIERINCSIDPMDDVYKLLDNAINEELPETMKEGGFIKDGFDKDLDEYRKTARNGKSLIIEMEQRERERTGIKLLKIAYNRVFGYCIEVTNSFKNLVPEDYERRQTLVGSERYTTPELKELEEKILSGGENAIKREGAIFSDIKTFLISKIMAFQKTGQAIGALDAIISLATVAREKSYCKPVICDALKPLNIVEGKHPVVCAVSKEQFVPNDTYLDGGDSRTMIITGPNMAGKSTYMRQVALITLMAHIGSFVPAKSAEIPITDRIFTRIGASDNLIYDQSTFMVEMTEVAYILLNATNKSLIILDEIGRGTSTYDGLSIAWSVIEYITEKLHAKTLFATHYHELTELEGKMEGVKNYKVTVKEYDNSIIFLRRIMRGGANRSFGIEVAAMSGVPSFVTSRAKEILKKLELSYKSSEKKSVKDTAPTETLSETERIIGDINIDNMTPLQALSVLTDLQEKIKGKKA